MWLGFFLQYLGLFDGCSGAIIPLNPEGLKGIFFSPFLHGNIEHIFGNSVPIFVLIFLLFQFYPFIAKKVFFLGWFVSAFLVWLLPPIDIFTGNFNFVYYRCQRNRICIGIFPFFQWRFPVEYEAANRFTHCGVILRKFGLGCGARRTVYES